MVHQSQQEEIRRSYSIISSPELGELLAVGVKRIENGILSRLLIDRAKVGDQVLTSGAAGFFTLPKNVANYRQVFMLAAGNGITPIFSLLKTLLTLNPTIAIVLIYSNSSLERTMFKEELDNLQASFPERFKIEYLFSNATNLSRARLHKDLLKLLIAQYAVAPYAEILFYICGPLNYMRMANYALHEVGVPPDNIKRENFNTEKPIIKAEPPDKGLHQAIIYFKKQQFEVEVQYPGSILKAAKKAGAVLPYSCEAGVCGNCVATCTNGQVWMAYNEVLTDKEVAQGLTLTCVGFPVGGNVELIFLG
ncbi:flavin reductase family protein [Adhaeribacter aquaticus]|uniref:flavin reductase family protein n=1 Tax=Adhaeribacter aquaticus TaxID=299567 RepID=UPI00041D9797|nr:iron-sulfur cluster-binding domain-containing protein [Adhaeribacter aquaticus]